MRNTKDHHDITWLWCFSNLRRVNCILNFKLIVSSILQWEGRLYDRASLSRRKRRRWRALTISQRGSADCRSPRIKKQQKQEIIKNNKAHLCLAPNEATLGLWQWKYFSWWGTSTHLLCLLCRPIGNDPFWCGWKFFQVQIAELTEDQKPPESQLQ